MRVSPMNTFKCLLAISIMLWSLLGIVRPGVLPTLPAYAAQIPVASPTLTQP